MQHDNNIENKLREMEAMEQPDLSQVDAHWQQMAGMLQPAALPVKKGWPKWMLNGLSAAAVVILIGVALWYAIPAKNNREEDTIAKNQTLTKQNDIEPKADSTTGSMHDVSTMALPDSIINDPLTTALAGKIKINPALIYDSGLQYKKWTTEDSILATIKINYTPCDECPDKKSEMTGFGNSRQAKLQILFGQLEKEEQRFVIDNSKDTLLQFKEGTVLLVPANSFGGMNGVEIRSREFYKTSDIVLNQMSTVSDKEQLETGGMLRLSASYRGADLEIRTEKPITLFLPETTKDMNGMQLFMGQQHGQQSAIAGIQLPHDTGVEKNVSSKMINWIPSRQYFVKKTILTEARVLNIIDQPYSVKQNASGIVGYFMTGDSLAIEKDQLKKILIKKYGYNTVILRSNVRDRFKGRIADGRDFSRDYAERIGDSVWMDKKMAEQYGLKISGTRTRLIEEVQPEQPKVLKAQPSPFARDTARFLNSNKQKAGTATIVNSAAIPVEGPGTWLLPQQDGIAFVNADVAAGNPVRNIPILNEIKSRYSVNLSELGWINCDRFSSDSRKKINYKVNLSDSADNYYTMLVFDKLNSMMTGIINGNEVIFQNIPIGEPVKIISIGINQKGETVYSVTHTTTSEQELKGLQFQTTSVPDLKASLSKLDN